MYNWQILSLTVKPFLCPTFTSHNSARFFLQHVLTYLQEEKAHGAIFGPFPSPFWSKHSNFPLYNQGEVSHKMRVIIDLSFPPDHSVNSGVPKNVYLGTAFKLHYQTIDMITQRLCDIGPGPTFIKLIWLVHLGSYLWTPLIGIS